MREIVRREKRKKREESDVVMFKEMKKKCYVVL
jgi:hypothetical protein